jgi:hypothetical protein
MGACSPASVDSTSASMRPAWNAAGSARSIGIVGNFWPHVGPTRKYMKTSARSAPESSHSLMLFAEEVPARTFPWPVAAREWLESGADSSLKWFEFVSRCDDAGARDSSSGRTSMDPLVLTTAEISRLSSVHSRVFRSKSRPTVGDELVSSKLRSLRGGGIALGGCSMRNSSEWPSDAVACSLSQVLETDVAPKYFLSPRACRGILRRAEKREKDLPLFLKQALERVSRMKTAEPESESENPEM